MWYTRFLFDKTATEEKFWNTLQMINNSSSPTPPLLFNIVSWERRADVSKRVGSSANEALFFIDNHISNISSVAALYSDYATFLSS